MPLPQASMDRGDINRKLLKDIAFERLYTAIKDGTLQPGEELRDDQLLVWLGMSKNPVRNAMLRLRDLGLVEMGVGRPTRVSPLDPERSNRALLPSGMVNEWAVRRTVASLPDTQRHVADAAVQALRDAVADDDRLAVERAMSDFFVVFTDATGSGVVRWQVNRLSQELARFMQPGGSRVDPQAALAGIEQINAAVQARDADQAAAATAQLYAPTRAVFLAHARVVTPVEA